jgi:hypothetical protein
MIKGYIKFHMPYISIATVAIGNRKKQVTTTISKRRIRIKIARSAIMRNVLTNMPIPIEKPISPWRYSFLMGLKYVRKKSGREKSWKKALFRETKK